MELDPSLITPFDSGLNADDCEIEIFDIKYRVDLETFETLMKFEADPLLFFVKPKNRKEKKFFEKKKIFSFDVWFVLKKSDLDSYYRSI